MTEREIVSKIVRELKKVTPTVREGVYTGDDCDKYITFVTSARGVCFSNNRPSNIRLRLTATLWGRHGADTESERRSMIAAIETVGGTYPMCTVSSSDGWQMIVYESEFVAAVTGG